MEVALAFILLAGLIALPFLMRRAGRSLNRAIQPNAHRKGQELVKAPVAFSAPRPPAEVLAAIRSTVNGYPSPPAVMPGLYERPVDPTTVAFTFGSKVGTVFSGILTCTPVDTGTTGQFRIAKWTEDTGIVARHDEIQRLRDRITSAIEGLGGSVSVSAS